MARAASKKQAAQNAQMVQILTYGFLITNAIHLFLVFVVFRRSSGTKGAFFKYLVTEGVAGTLGLMLKGMAKQGDDLAQAGLTSYMFDIIYVTWFVHLTTAVLSARFWYTYLVIPMYAFYFGYKRLLVPFILGGKDPLAGLWQIFAAKTDGSTATRPAAAVAEEPGMSKRQAKLQKRMEKGDPRVQTRQR